MLEHGPVRESAMMGTLMKGVRRDGSPDPAYLRSEASWESYVRLGTADDDREYETFISASVAKSLAAALTHAANRIEIERGRRP